MKTINTKVSFIIASAILVSPFIVSADDSSMTSPNWTQMNMMSWVLSSEQKDKIWTIMKSLESDLKYIRENLTKENYTEMKKKAEELKLAYIAKVNEAFPNIEEAKKILENRFAIFFKNQFVIREQIKEIKDKAMETASGAIQKAKELKKQENTQLRDENKQIRQDLKTKYKQKFVAQLKNKLESLSNEKLEKIISNVEKKREQISSNEKLKVTTKEKYLAQLDALLEILKDNLNETDEDELNVDEIIEEATN